MLADRQPNLFSGAKMSFLGIDLGTTYIKGAVLDLEARRLEHVRRAPFPPPLPNPNSLFCEVDPDAILTAVRALIAVLAPHAPHCEGMVMCSQMHGLVLMNGRGGAESHCITWRDQRALMPHPSGEGSYFDVLTQRLTPRQVSQLGNELDPGRPVCYLFWFGEQKKLGPGLTLASVPDFVLGALCGAPTGAEVTNAAAYSALNLETIAWHQEVIGKLGLEHLHWPVLRRQGEVVGYTEINGARVPCYPPVGDYQCALAGALFGAEDLSLNIATGSQISRMMPALTLGDYQTRPFFDGKFLKTFTGLPAGRSLNVLVDLLCEAARGQGVELDDPWQWIAKAAADAPDAGLEVDLSFFGPPRLGKGQIANIRGSNLTVGQLFRAAFKHMAEANYRHALRLWPEKAWKNLLFSGGLACKLEVLRRIIQQRFAARCRIAPFDEDTLFGLLILASVYSGRARSVEEFSRELRDAPTLRQAGSDGI
jgi:sugar (pentulose or hexulose) kinase